MSAYDELALMQADFEADLVDNAIGWTVIALDGDGVVLVVGFYADPVAACAHAGRLTAEADPDETDPFRFEVHPIQPSTP